MSAPSDYRPLKCGDGILHRSSIVAGQQARQQGRRRGTTHVETSREISRTAPVFFLLVTDSLKFWRIVMIEQNFIEQILSRVVCMGAVRKEVPQTIAAAIENYLAHTSAARAKVRVALAALHTIRISDAGAVSVSVSFDQITWIPVLYSLQGRFLSGESIMRGK